MNGNELVAAHRAALNAGGLSRIAKVRIKIAALGAGTIAVLAAIFDLIVNHYWFGVITAHLTVIFATDAVAHVYHLPHLATAAKIAVVCDFGLLAFECFELCKHERALREAKLNGGEVKH
jgi:hypothetical protein